MLRVVALGRVVDNEYTPWDSDHLKAPPAVLFLCLQVLLALGCVAAPLCPYTSVDRGGRPL